MKTADSSDPAAQLRASQIVGGALTLGVLLFSGIAAFLGPVAEPLPLVAFGLDVVALAAIAASISMVAVSFVLPPRICDSARDAEPAARMQAFLTSRLVGAALCEGPALLWCIALLLSGNRWFLVPIALLALLIAMRIPTRDAFEAATGQRAR